MERCVETTPANVMDSLFNFIRRHTPCEKLSPKAASASKVSTNDSSSLIASTFIALLTWVTLLIIH